MEFGKFSLLSLAQRWAQKLVCWADVGIDTSTGFSNSRGLRCVAWHPTDDQIGYCFFIDSDQDFFYRKTTDGGATWGAIVEIDTDTTITCVAFDIWADWWTPGDTGTTIHITWFESGDGDVNYRPLDISTDTRGTQVIAFNGASAVAGIGASCSITKAVGGNIYVAAQIDAGAEVAFVRSTNAGVSFAARTSGYLAAPTGDWMQLFPAANTGDTQDVIGFYLDSSASSLLARWYDDSANTWTSSSSVATVIQNTTDLTGQFPFAASIRHSDGHLIVVAHSAYDSAVGFSRTYDVNRTSTAFSITNGGFITFDIDDHYYTSVFIDQSTDDIYIAYNGKRDGSETLGSATKVYYATSTDGGSTWSSGDTAYMEGAAAAVVQVWTPLMGPRFGAVWKQGSTAIHYNAVNSFTFAADPVLVADVGSFTITGTAASLEKGFEVEAGVGSFLITGTDASLEKGFEVSAEAGSFIITGTDASLEADRTLTAEAGSVTITGTDASLAKGRTLTALAGKFDIVGTAASLEKTTILTADSGSVTITGTAASLEKTTILTADAGSVTITGTAASLEKGFELIADGGSVLVTGTAASLEKTSRLAADSGSFAITGTAASLLKGRTLAADSGSVAITGTAASLEKDSELAAEAGAFSISGTAASLEKGFSLAAGAGSLVITGIDASLEKNSILRADAGSFVITGADADLTKFTPGVYILEADAGSIAITGTAATLTKSTAEEPAAPRASGGALGWQVGGRAPKRVNELTIEVVVVAFTFSVEGELEVERRALEFEAVFDLGLSFEANAELNANRELKLELLAELDVDAEPALQVQVAPVRPVRGWAEFGLEFNLSAEVTLEVDDNQLTTSELYALLAAIEEEDLNA